MSRQAAIIIETPEKKEVLIVRVFRTDDVTPKQAFENLLERARGIAEKAYEGRVALAQHRDEPVPEQPDFDAMTVADKLNELQASDFDLEGLELETRIDAEVITIL